MTHLAECIILSHLHSNHFATLHWRYITVSSSLTQRYILLKVNLYSYHFLTQSSWFLCITFRYFLPILKWITVLTQYSDLIGNYCILLFWSQDTNFYNLIFLLMSALLFFFLCIFSASLFPPDDFYPINLCCTDAKNKYCKLTIPYILQNVWD